MAVQRVGAAVREQREFEFERRVLEWQPIFDHSKTFFILLTPIYFINIIYPFTV